MKSVPRVLAVLPLLLVLACTTAEQAPERAAGETRAAPDGLRVLGAVPDFTLTDQDGRPFGRSDLQGRVWIATFIFTRCGSTCPLQTAEFGRLQEDLGSDQGAEDLRLVSFTVDPEHDTPAVLKAYAADAGADATRWRFLTGSRAELRELSKSGFKLPVLDTPDNPTSIITHSQMFVLVDRQGRIRGYYDGLDPNETQTLRSDVRTLLVG